jgi:hypothetical protein
MRFLGYKVNLILIVGDGGQQGGKIEVSRCVSILVVLRACLGRCVKLHFKVSDTKSRQAGTTGHGEKGYKAAGWEERANGAAFPKNKPRDA